MELHHVTDADLHTYYLGGFLGLELDLLDEHLQWCPPCIERLAAIESCDIRRHCFLAAALQEVAA